MDGFMRTMSYAAKLSYLIGSPISVTIGKIDNKLKESYEKSSR